MSEIPIVKDENSEGSVPTRWRPVLKFIADALVSGRPPISLGIRAVDADALKISIGNIADYPDVIGPLTEASWKTSVYIWTGSYWDVLVDLISETGEISDLVLQVKVYPTGQEYEFQPHLVYIP
ncbi:hypothetical protein [uncultured Ruegeria sp.]|uniref:DUF7668 domain-containing protein n=1 Tax=uncultured Ruegeria sp. TaxID=259304 RepID=UPI0026313AEF|nr:hypothetical protein [uncultured Ruegeria sp.]